MLEGLVSSVSFFSSGSYSLSDSSSGGFPVLSGRDLLETSYIGLSVPRSPTFCKLDSCRSSKFFSLLNAETLLVTKQGTDL